MNLNQVTLPAVDLPRSVRFYQTLGLKLIVDSPHYARFECPDGDATFSLHAVDGEALANPALIYFECSDLDQRVADLKASGIEFDSDPQDQRWLWREARLRDPSGNPVCLYFAGENRKNPPWRVNA